MTPWLKSLVIAAVQVGLVASLGLKLLYDRATLPRGWALAVPYDPNLPIRGRYVKLQLVVEPRGLPEQQPRDDWRAKPAVVLRLEDDRLVAEADPRRPDYHPADLHVQFIHRHGDKLAVLDKTVAFFIPEHHPDPSRRPPPEELWVEVTLPKQGLPRPIRLGLKQPDGRIVPLPLK